MYAALDLGQRTIQAVLKGQDGKIVNELKIKKQADTVLRFLKGTDANVVMESGFNYQYLYDLPKSKGYNVKVANPLMVKAIAYANVKTNQIVSSLIKRVLAENLLSKKFKAQKVEARLKVMLYNKFISL